MNFYRSYVYCKRIGESVRSEIPFLNGDERTLISRVFDVFDRGGSWRFVAVRGGM